MLAYAETVSITLCSFLGRIWAVSALPISLGNG